MSNETLEIFCCRCRKKTPSKNIEYKTLKNGKPAAAGTCSECGTHTYTILKGAAVK